MSVLITSLYSASWILPNLGSNLLSVSAGISVPFVDLTSKQTSPLRSLPCLNLPPRSWTSSWAVFWTSTLLSFDAKCPFLGRLLGTPTFAENPAKRQRSRAERRWLKSGLAVDKQVYFAAERAVSKNVHEAKSKDLSSTITECDSSK